MNSRNNLDEYQTIVRGLSDRIVEAQTPVRVLDAVKWDDATRQAFFAAKGRELPQIDRAYYEGRPLAFDSSAKKQEFQDIERDITVSSASSTRSGNHAAHVQGIPHGHPHARGAWYAGFRHDLPGALRRGVRRFHAGDPTLADLGLMLSDYLNNIADRGDLRDEPKNLTAPQAVELLQSAWTWCLAKARA